jgi:transposase-like protein
MDTSTPVGPIATDALGRRIVRRRFRTAQEKQLIVAEASAPRALMAELARRHGVNTNLAFAWRRLRERGLLAEQERGPAKKGKLLPVRRSDEPKIAGPDTVPCIEIALAGRVRVRSYGTVDVALRERHGTNNNNCQPKAVLVVFEIVHDSLGAAFVAHWDPLASVDPLTSCAMANGL